MARSFAKLMSLLKPKWCWAQFSMRSPLLLITAICVGLGAWVVPAERHRRAVAAVEVLGRRLV